MRYVQAESALFQMIDEEGVILDIESGHYFRINPTAVSIWLALEKPMGVKELSAAIAAEYDSDDETTQQDVSDTIAKLAELGLVGAFE